MALNFSSRWITASMGYYGCSCSHIFRDLPPPPPPPPSPDISSFYKNAVDLLPADPFGMGIPPAVSGVIDDLTATSSNYIEFGDVGCHPEAAAVEAAPHEGLFFALPHLKLPDLLSMEMVCKSLNCAIRDDPLLWRCIHIEQPLNFTINDDQLLQLTRRAKGNLECLLLRECRFITDSCLGLVLKENLKLRKLSIPSCPKITINSLLDILKNHKLNGGTLKHLSLGRLYDMKPEQYCELQVLLGLENSPLTKPRFYHLPHSVHCGAHTDDRKSLDVEPCPLCGSIRVIYDCPLHDRLIGLIVPCRACAACISRCNECGRCIYDLDYEETFFLDRVCFPCMKYPSESQLLGFDSQLTD